MSNHVIVVGTNHILQGAVKNSLSIIDPLYRSYITSIIPRDEVDFVFEEGSGLGPTIAEEIAEDTLGKDHYLDVDPSIAQRKVLGIGVAGEHHDLDPLTELEVHDLWGELFVPEQRKRENAWLQAIQGQSFSRGLLVCGLAHLLSIAFNLDSSGYSVEARAFNP